MVQRHRRDSTFARRRVNARGFAVWQSGRARVHALVTLIALAGCEPGEHAEPQDAALPDASETGSDAGTSSTPVAHQVSGTITDLQGRGISGARICIVAHEEVPCGVSDTTGEYTMLLPVWTPRKEIAFYVSAAGYLSATLLLARSPSANDVDWFSGIRLMDDAAATQSFGVQAGFRVPAPDRAFVQVQVDLGTLAASSTANVTLTIEPAGGPPPVYAEAAGDYDRTRSAVTRFGRALFAEVPPGRFEVSFVGCALMSDYGSGMWRATNANAVAGVAVAGAVTVMTAACN